MHAKSIMNLYKYNANTSNKYRNQIIKNKNIWFSCPLDFNDPLDSNLDYQQNYSTKEIKDFWENYCTRHKECDFGECLSLYGTSEAFVEQQNRIFKKQRKTTGVACFSVTPTNILMWSHYANNHQGIVYEFTPDLFEASLSEHFTGKPIRVDYLTDNSYEPLSYAKFGKEKEQQFVFELLGKATDWAYEQEYRFIDLNVDKGFGRNKSFKPASLKSIIFGAKTPEDEKQRIKELCAKKIFLMLFLSKPSFKPIALIWISDKYENNPCCG